MSNPSWALQSISLTTKTSIKKLKPKSTLPDPSTHYYGDVKYGTSRNITLKKSWHIKNHQVRRLLFNIPNIKAFIDKRTATYIGQISRSNPRTYPKRFLTVWINGKKTNGHPQLTCNNNYATEIGKIMPKDNPLINQHALLKEWLP